MKKSIDRFIALILSMMVIVGCSCVPALADSAEGLDVDNHSQQEIIEYINASGVSVCDPVQFEVEPVINTQRGRLARKSHNGAVAMLNNVRYVAGLDPVCPNDGYESLAQAAAFVNMSINELTHYPADVTSRPSAMSINDWNDGCTGASKSNLYCGGGDLNYYALWWTSDEDPGNIEHLGHRRWCLNPSMGSTGYGYADGFAAMYALDKSGTGIQSNVAWPAENMPIEFFGYDIPWSISTGREIDRSSIKVELTRRNDGKVWTFRGTETYATDSSKYFNVNNTRYGQKGCIIFRPDGIKSYKDGDIFDVVIYEDGYESIRYTVNFFSLDKYEIEEISKTSISDLRVSSLKRGRATASWSGASNVSGYQIQYSTSRAFKNKKSKKVTMPKLAIKKLKPNKTYYFRVRNYKKVRNPISDEINTYYGQWSKIIKVKVKK